jgi:hypothetical protein
MRPNQEWFPTSRTLRAAWFRNFTMRFAEIGPVLGFSQADIDSVNADNEVFQYTVRTMVLLRASMRSAQSFARTITEGKDSGKDAQFPSIVLPPAPPEVPPGIFTRLTNLVRRIRAAPGFTRSHGALLGINLPERTTSDYFEFVPKLKVNTVQATGQFTVKTTMLRFDAFTVYVERIKSQKTETAGVFTSSPATVTIEPTNPGTPEEIYVSVRMMKSNKAVTQTSAMHRIVIDG